MPSAPGIYTLQVRIFADEITKPLLVEHQFGVAGEVTEIGENEFFEKFICDEE